MTKCTTNSEVEGEANEVVIIKTKVDKSINEIKSSFQSNNTIQQRNALKQIQILIQEIHQQQQQSRGDRSQLVLIQILQRTGTLSSTSNNNQNTIKDSEKTANGTKPENCQALSLGSLLLEIVSNRNNISSEICREKSALCLQSCFKTLLLSIQQQELCIHNFSHVLEKNFIHDFYIDYCSILGNRFGFKESSSNCNVIENSCTSPSWEDSEEIRLILIQIMSDMLVVMQHFCQTRVGSNAKNRSLGENEGSNNETNLKEEQTGQEDHHTNDIKNEKRFISATTLICQVIAKSSSIDPYPELKRESCVLVKQLAYVFPNVVHMNKKILLDSLLGGSIVNIDNYSSDNMSTKSAKILSNSLIRHRHAKTRSLALETVVEIMHCHFHDCHTTMDNRDVLKVSLERGPGKSKILEEKRKHDNNEFDSRITRESALLDECLVSHVLPNLESTLLFDHSTSVRIALANAVGNLLQLVLLQPFSTPPLSASRLMVLSLIGISDDVDKVQKIGLDYLKKNASHWRKCNYTDTVSAAANGDKSHVVSYFVDMIGCNTITIILQRILAKSSIDSSKHYLDALCCIIRLHSQRPTLEGNYQFILWKENDDLKAQIISILCTILSENEDEDSIFQAAMKCSKSFGFTEDTRKSALALINESFIGSTACGPSSKNNNLLGDSENTSFQVISDPKIIISSAQQCASAVNFIAGLIQGWHSIFNAENGVNIDTSQVYDDFGQISMVLTSTKILETAYCSASAALALFTACHALVNFIASYDSIVAEGSWCKKSFLTVKNITWCCVNLLACPKSFNMTQPSLKLLQSFSCLSSDTPTYADPLDTNFKFMLQTLRDDLHDKKIWKSGDQNAQIFDALIRASEGKTIGEHFDEIIEIFVTHLSKDNSHKGKIHESKDEAISRFSTKLFFMALFESIVSSSSFPRHYIHPFVENFLQVAIIPNLVWQVGGMASALRKVSAAVLFTILEGDCTTDLVIFKITPQLLPILKSSLTDDDTSLREMAISSMAIVLDKLPGALGEEAVHKLYPELIKCLDDNFESVRYAACDTLKNFLKCAPAKHFQGTAISYMVEYLFIHLDDPDPCFKEKIYEVLVGALDIDSNEVIKGAESSLLSHCSRYYCDRLLICASERKKLQKLI